MTWNYRIMRHVEPDDAHWYAVHEVYYDGDGVDGHVSDGGVRMRKHLHGLMPRAGIEPGPPSTIR